MTNYNRIEDLASATAYDIDGDKVGSVKDVYLNDATGQPDFVSVNHGLFGINDSIVPLRGHSLRDGELHLAFSKDRIKDAPNLDENGHLTTEDQDAFYRHYGLQDTQDVTHYGEVAGAAGAPAAGAGAPVADGAAGAAGDALIRSEERVNIDKDRVATGTARLRKYVVEDTETVEVPVQREEVRVVREPITDADRAAGLDTTIGEGEAAVTLHEERLNVTKETVPVEKVSLEKDVVQDTETVTENVRKEQFETDGLK